MTSLTTTIVKLYEEQHWDLNLIAKEVGFEVDEVKAVLVQYSGGYRKDIKAEVGTDYNDNDLALATSAIKEVMLSTEDEHLRVRCARYIRDDKKGRLDAIAGLGGLNINIFEFNDALRQARLAKEATENGKRPIEIEAEVSK